ncbi:NUDIX hydrolase [Streptomyces stelliscabiei]|uniref:8-oxo-dGTP diphosphatase n=1 Tax=Streptomyces stelliscabiei TaxID=146820 RepID=A0A8I0TQU1_9ACTN|nr:NUDIX hydrolase [Streptomyces stelliscabiei]KND41178.1 DNA mismatch repair protein MutT [Streptomyces stelliscabiei]MBE1598310.1 8-oxo-dGTP diphosphatase [Streptomyces stelliscabiei]MDX2522004.1 NUDIX hydrolase [Streptomyces stelliscabiei]MDX2556030.1 NUDIX hydrolase [Streptomyces stelliscabiei]MDX2617639.1 NUDIX hydrolase [Streptomyces stelliscabiei]
MDITPLVRAAGCALWRRPSSAGGIELALVYRPKWSDWSLPKGKLKRDEDARDGALREVLEETGMRCALGPELPTVHYTDHQGRPKQVRYWAAEATRGTFTPNSEVSDLLWLPPEAATRRLTHERDRTVVSSLLEALHKTGTDR